MVGRSWCWWATDRNAGASSGGYGARVSTGDVHRGPGSGRVVAQLHRADVFALPVRTRLGGLDPEGLGLAALEASACGLPVVVGRSGGAPETVRQGRTGYVVDPDDPYELATRLADLLADPDQARELGVAGRVFVADRYGADRARRVLRTSLGLPGVATV